MSKYNVILWDLDDTLLDFEYSQAYALSRCFCSIGRKLQPEELTLYSKINRSYWERLERGEITKEELIPGRFLTLFEQLGIEGVDVDKFRKKYQEALGSVFSFRDDALTICQSLRGIVKQYVITNGVAHTQLHKLRLSGLAETMDGIFISDEIGYQKPDSEFFQYCLDHMEEKDLSKILVVGDSLTSDMLGGIRMGIPTCWYNPSGTSNDSDIHPDMVIDDLHRIYDVLEVFGNA